MLSSILLVLFLGVGDLYIKKGVDLAEKGKYEEAKEFFLKALKYKYYDVNLHFYLGEVYLFTGDNDNAIKHFKMSLKLYPFSTMQKSIALPPKFSYCYFYLGLSYFLKQEYKKALNNFLRAVRINSALKEAYYNIAVIYEQRGNRFLASKYYKRYIKEMEIEKALE